jgi:hypothetical protein
MNESTGCRGSFRVKYFREKKSKKRFLLINEATSIKTLLFLVFSPKFALRRKEDRSAPYQATGLPDGLFLNQKYEFG